MLLTTRLMSVSAKPALRKSRDARSASSALSNEPITVLIIEPPSQEPDGTISVAQPRSRIAIICRCRSRRYRRRRVVGVGIGLDWAPTEMFAQRPQACGILFPLLPIRLFVLLRRTALI